MALPPWRRQHKDLLLIQGDGEWHLSQEQRDALCAQGEADFLHWHAFKAKTSFPLLEVAADGSTVSLKTGATLYGAGFTKFGFSPFLTTKGSSLVHELSPGTLLEIPYTEQPVSIGYGIWIKESNLYGSPVLRVNAYDGSGNVTVGSYTSPATPSDLPLNASYYTSARPWTWVVGPGYQGKHRIIDAASDGTTGIVTLDPAPASLPVGTYLFPEPPLTVTSEPSFLYMTTLYKDGGGNWRPMGLKSNGWVSTCWEFLSYFGNTEWITRSLEALPPHTHLVGLTGLSTYYYLTMVSTLASGSFDTILGAFSSYRSGISFAGYRAAGSFASPVLYDVNGTPILNLYVSLRSYIYVSWFVEF